MSLVLRIAGAATTYIFVVAMARVMSVPDFGLLGALMSAALLLSVFASVGQQFALLRFVPYFQSSGQHMASKALTARAGLLMLKGNLAVFVALAGAVFLSGQVGWLGRYDAVLIGLLILPLVGVIDFQAALSRSYHHVALAIAPKEILWRLLSLAVVAIYLLSSGASKISAELVFAILAASLSLLIIFAYLVGTRAYSLPRLVDLVGAEAGDESLVEWRKARVPFWVSSTSGVAFSNLDVVLAALLIGPEGAALYFAANRIAMAPNFIQQSFLFVVSPNLSQSLANNDLNFTRRIAQKASLEIFVPTLAICMLLGVAGSFILQLFGPAFEHALGPLLILLFSVVAQSALGIAEVALNMCGGERQSMRVGVYTLLIGPLVVSACGLIWGIVGVAVGTTLVMLWRRLWFWHLASTTLGLRLDVFSSLRAYRNDR